MRIAVVAVSTVVLALTTAAQPDTPLPPTTVKFKKADATLGEVAAELSKASGIPIRVDPAIIKEKCPAAFDGTPLWDSLERAVAQAKAKIVLVERGCKIVLEPKGQSKAVSAVSGPFRVVATQVVGRALLDLGITVYEVDLDVHWEPRYTVFRIDAGPKTMKIADDANRPLEAKPAVSRVQPDGASSTMKVTLGGVSRQSKQIAVLAGEFQVTAAPKMLAFKFDDLTAKLPVSKSQDRVMATLKRITKDEAVWVVGLELRYPPGQPAFESFESEAWLRNNRPRFVSPDGSKSFDADGYEYTITDEKAGGRKVQATYTFKGFADPLAKGWSLVYETPAPLVEFTVPFELRNIPLP